MSVDFELYVVLFIHLKICNEINWLNEPFHDYCIYHSEFVSPFSIEIKQITFKSNLISLKEILNHFTRKLQKEKIKVQELFLLFNQGKNYFN